MTKEQALQMAEQAGFSHWGIFQVSSLRFRQEVRDMCEADRCNKYNKTWTCPPACGTLEEIREKAEQYDWGILIQTTAYMEDQFDAETMVEAMGDQRVHFLDMVDKIRELEPGIDFLPMSSGGCDQCQTCTYPSAPCRFPEKAYPSMEAYGLLVTDSCKAAGVEYYYGKDTITFSSCILFHGGGSCSDSIAEP
ncbi:MAG: DUF2284 domain-containing protein [Eubacterium sp.]|nr:DUF2284 domain-containing protein [Eubacterium sp.]